MGNVEYMENMEMVELIREKANVSYEEAKVALEEAGWDMLSAMVMLEKQGKVKKPKKGVVIEVLPEEKAEKAAEEKTAKMEKKKNKKAKRQKKAEDKEAKRLKRMERSTKMRQGLHKFWDVLRFNYLEITRDEDMLFKMPGWLFVLLLFISWKIMAPLMIVGLFLGVRYSFSGKDDLQKANDFMDKASNLAEDIKAEVVG